MKTLVAVSQMTSKANKDSNLAQCEEMICKAKKLGAKLFCLPENFAFFGQSDEETIKAGESLAGPSISRLRDCAKKNEIWLSLGGFQEKVLNEKKMFNTHLIIDDRGQIKATYRKINLFLAKVPGGQFYDESIAFLPGSKITSFDAGFFKVGLSICFDLRFPFIYQNLRQQGADVLLIPAAFTKPTGEAHWHVLLRARAIETQCYVLAAAQQGKHNNNRETYGHAMIIDPWGKILAECSAGDDMALAWVDLKLVKSVRERMCLFRAVPENTCG